MVLCFGGDSPRECSPTAAAVGHTAKSICHQSFKLSFAKSPEATDQALVTVCPYFACIIVKTCVEELAATTAQQHVSWREICRAFHLPALSTVLMGFLSAEEVLQGFQFTALHRQQQQPAAFTR